MVSLPKVVPEMRADFELSVYAQDKDLSLEKKSNVYTDATTQMAWELWQAAYESCRRLLTINWQFGVTPNPLRGKQAYLVTLRANNRRWVALRTYDPNASMWMNGTDPEFVEVIAWAIPPEPAPATSI